MAYDRPQPGTLKRKRRRREDKPTISARLYLDSNLNGEIGVLSQDLVDDLYPGHGDDTGAGLHAALCPWTPTTSLSGSTWTALPFRSPVKGERQLPPSTIRFPATALGTQSFVSAIQSSAPSRNIRQNAAIEVRISDVIPLPLETVYVSLDVEALQKIDDVQKKYGGGFMNTNGQAGRKGGKRTAARPMSPSSTSNDSDGEGVEDRRRQLILTALSALKVVHTDDLVPLQLAHPITHASAPPAKILACEPVAQGVLSAASRIVVVPATDKRQAAFGSKPVLSSRLPEESDDGEDTANEAFYSATEENSPAKPVVTSKSATDMSNSEDLFDSSAEDSNLSDDSDDMISLVRPGLITQPSGLSSVLTSATPRPFGSRTGASTPGSVFSNVTTTTIRGGQSSRSKIFHTQGLLQQIPVGLLHPKPPSDEDEEARVYVDAQALARLGCFSGDWVKLEPAESHILPNFGAFGNIDGSSTQLWRPVKVYSLPESMSKRPQRYQVNPKHGRRDSISSLATNAATVSSVYLSPILLANLGQAANVSVSPLSFIKRTSLKRPASSSARPGSVSARLPPVASEVTLRKIVTPLSNERALNHALFAGLKEHFENKQRVLKAGDLIAVPVDEALGRSIYEGELEKESLANSELLSSLGHRSTQDDMQPRTGHVGVAWFAVEGVTTTPEEHDLLDGVDIWGGAAAIDPRRMTMRQSGDDNRALPPTLGSVWPYYLGARRCQAQSTTAPPGATGLPDPPQLFVSNIQRRLRELISVSTSPRAIHLAMPPLALLLKSTPRNIGKAYIVQRTCEELGMHYFPIDAYDIVSEGSSGFDTQAQGLLEARCERAMECGSQFTVICLKHLDTLNSDRVAASLKTVLGSCRVLVATTTDVDKIPDIVRGLFTHELEMSAPDESEREGILRDVVNKVGVPVAPNIDFAAVAVKTAALVAGDLVDVVDRAVVARSSRLESLAKTTSQHSGHRITIKDVTICGGAAANQVISTDFEEAVDFARKNFADSIGAPKIPNVQWSDVGGLTHVKDAVIETIQLPLSRPELFAKGLKKRSGILFYGPPGTGKTLLAKAIATEFSLNFFSVKGPELLNMYIGESEANVRRVFQRARDARPCVVFFDELDSVAPKRGNQGDSGGVMDRIVSQLLAELDGMSDGEQSGGGVFVIGATNRPDLLDQALLRPGRFDKMLYLGISDTHEKQATILQALTRKFTLDPSVSLPNVAETLPFTFTGADLYALCSDAMLKAVTRSAQLVDQKLAALNAQRASSGQNALSIANYFDYHATASDTDVSVVEQDFANAKKELVPSVSLDELRHYERVRDNFEGVAKKSGTHEDNTSSGGQGHDGESNMLPSKRPTLGKRPTQHGVRVNGTNGIRSFQNPPKDYTNRRLSPDEDNDDFVVRTDRLELNDAGKKGHVAPGKGKGKGKAQAVVDNRARADAEDLYD